MNARPKIDPETRKETTSIKLDRPMRRFLCEVSDYLGGIGLSGAIRWCVLQTRDYFKKVKAKK